MSAAVQSNQLPDLPYPGIEPFNYARRKVFFARDKEARSLMQLIAMYRGVLLYSDSGTGKSSLVNAGLIPLAVDRGFQPERIRVQPRRGEEIIVERLSESVDDIRPFLPSVFASDEEHERVVVSVEEFEKTLRQPELAVRPLLIFDQFEEWITLFEEGSRGEAANDARIAQKSIREAIVSLINDRKLPVKVLIALREDYLAKLDPLFEQCPSLPDQYLRLTALAGDQVYRAIRGPFEEHPGRYEVEVGPALAQKIREQFEQRSEGADVHLTEVQIVCRSLFEAGTSGQEIDRYFSDEGGVQGILERYLELALESLDVDQQEPAVALLTRMLTSAGTRNVISEDDLLNRVENEDRIPRELLGETLQSLEQEAKLIRRERRREVYYYEIASEFLVGWIRRKALERQRLAEQRKLEEAHRRAEEQRKIARRFRRLAAALVVMVALAIVAAVIAYRQRQEAKEAQAEAEGQRQIADAQRLAAQATLASHRDPNLPVLLGVESMRRFPSWEADQALRQGLALLPRPFERLDPNHESPILSVAFSPDGKYLATAGRDQTARVWEATSGEQFARMKHEAIVFCVAFSPDGKYLATASDANTAQLWEATTGAPVPLKPMEHNGDVTCVAFSPDGKYLATASDANTAQLWEATTGAPVPLKPMEHDGDVTCVAFSPDGKYLATASQDMTARIWEAISGKELADLSHTAYVTSVAFSPNGKYLATASRDNRARLWEWEATANEEIASMLHEAPVLSVAFSPDGGYLATASQDMTARIWDATSGKEIARVNHGAPVTSVAFSPGGRYLASASDDTTAQVSLWRPEDLIAEASSRLTRNLTYDEWQRYLPDEPYSKTCPDLPVHRTFIKHGEDLARALHIEGAIVVFRRVVELDPSITLDPQVEAKKYAAESLVAKGKALAEAGDISGSIDSFQKAVELDISLDLDPKEEAQEAREKAGEQRKFSVETNSIGMKLVYISADSFMMGSSCPVAQLAEEYDRSELQFEDEFPRHEVHISEDFWMGQTEVTQGQYTLVIGAQPWSGKPFVQESANNPAVYVSWKDAVEFCRKLGQQEGKTYRLPTEAEWEYACRAGTTTRLSSGDSDSFPRDYAWFFENAYKTGQQYAHPVGQKKPNPWGLYDMHGNVYEWCSDYYDKDYYSESPPVDPNGPPTGDSHSLRSSSWYSHVSHLRCSSRGEGAPDAGYRDVGFRVVRQAKYSLTATAVNGSVRSEPNETGYDHGETVKLEAVPNNGYSFTNWSGDLSGSTNPVTIKMDSDKSVTASFALKADALVTHTGWIHKGCEEFGDREDVIGKGPITWVKVYYSGYIHGLQLGYAGHGGSVFGFDYFKDTDVKLAEGVFVVPQGQRIARVEGQIEKYYISRLRFITDKGIASPWFGGRPGRPFTADDKNGLPLRTISGWVNRRRHPSLNRAIASMTFHFGSRDGG